MFSNQAMQKLIFILPAVTLIGIFVIYPTIATIVMSFCSFEGGEISSFVGVENYNELFGDRRFLNVENLWELRQPWGALINTITWMIIFVPVTLLLGLILSVLVRDLRFNSIIKAMIFLGMVVPMVVGGIIILFMFDEHAGIVNGIIKSIGIEPVAWLRDPDYAIFALILGSIWIWTGFSMIIYSAGLELIPGDLYDAAAVDGASRWATFRHITVPMLKPSTLIVTVMSLIWVLRTFDIVYVAAGKTGSPGGATNILPLKIYYDAFLRMPPETGLAAANATMLTVISTVITIVLIRRLLK